jgi:hypothetical protein
MAAITFNTVHQVKPILGRFLTALSASREMLDTFVSHRIRLAAAKAELARPRHPRNTSLISVR